MPTFKLYAPIFRNTLRVEVAHPGAELRLRPLGIALPIETSFTLNPVDSGIRTMVVYSSIFRGTLPAVVFWLGLMWIPAPWSPQRVLMRKVTHVLQHRAGT